MTADAYARMLKLLLPPGKWRRDSGGTLSRVLLGAGDELARVDARGRDLQREADPREANELLPEFEATLGLASTGTLTERRARVVARLVLRFQRRRPVDYQTILAPLLGLDAEDVEIIERGRAFAIAVGDDREIYRFFVYRDPALPGTYSVADAQALLDHMADSHTKGHVIESVDFRCDDPQSLCDRDLLGV